MDCGKIRNNALDKSINNSNVLVININTRTL